MKGKNNVTRQNIYTQDVKYIFQKELEEGQQVLSWL